MTGVIKSKEEYEKILAQIEELMDRNPAAGTPEASKLELLILVVKDYETKLFPIENPDPVKAILFRMEQQNLTSRDLVPYIGSRSKVSEILSGKRPLTLSMIQALHAGLGIPIKALIQGKPISELDENEIIWGRFPIKEMIRRGWIKTKSKIVGDHAEEFMRTFLKPLGAPQHVLALYKKTQRVRAARVFDNYALFAWNSRIMIQALSDKPGVKYQPGVINVGLLKEVLKISTDSYGPQKAVEYLKGIGLPVIIEPQLPGTYLDGAAILTPEGPVIGLTLRYDRIDNFWFCLMHELAHVVLHLKKDHFSFYDDLDIDNDNPAEKEADELVNEVLIPRKEWENSLARRLRTPEAAMHLATKLNIHPAIVAGRMRYCTKSYRILNNLIGHGKVRVLFPEINWR